ncbi:MAG: DUF192 domain-containing protein [Patescibacteria group bacterium]|jgi:hypothetical protein
MQKYKFIIIFFIVIAALLYVAYYNLSYFNTQVSVVEIKGHNFDTDVVQSFADIERGLSGRASMDDNQAMLFVFPDKQKRTFWMKEMNFAIDLLWIDGQQIVAYEKNMLAPVKDLSISELPRYTSPQPVDKVLEIQAGLIDSLDIKIGDNININI